MINQLRYSKGVSQFVRQTSSTNLCRRTIARMNLKTYVYLLSFFVVICLFIQLIVPLFPSAVSYLGYHSVKDLMINQQMWAIDTAPLGKDFSQENAISPYAHRGRWEMSQSNVTFLGVARNIGGKLPGVLSQIANLGRMFRYSRVIIVEGDSSDNTLAILRNWEALSPNNRTILSRSSINATESHGYFAGSLLPREGRITQARNLALATMKSMAPTKYAVVIDMDILGWDPVGIIDGFGRTGWDVMCSHGILLHGIYRDTYAFRSPGIDTNHHRCGQDFAKYNMTKSDQRMNRENLKVAQRTTQARMAASQNRAYQVGRSKQLRVHNWIDIANGNNSFDDNSGGLMRVDSCFGGLALYKSELFNKCEYNFRHDEPPYMQDCEHVLLHKCMSKSFPDYRIVTNANMKLWYGHNPFTSGNIKKFLLSFVPSSK